MLSAAANIEQPTSSEDERGAVSYAWFLIQSKPRQAERAAEHLANQGYHCYLPLITTEKLQKGRRAHVTEPLFPGYLFIRLRPGVDNWQPIRSTRGVLRLVTFAGRPLPVPETVISGIQSRLSAESRQANPAISPGDKVTITSLSGELEGVFQRYDGEERVIVLLDIMHRQQHLSVALKDIQKV